MDGDVDAPGMVYIASKSDPSNNKPVPFIMNIAERMNGEDVLTSLAPTPYRVYSIQTRPGVQDQGRSI